MESPGLGRSGCRDRRGVSPRCARSTTGRVRGDERPVVPERHVRIRVRPLEQGLADAPDRQRLFALPPVAVTRFVERGQFAIAHFTPHDLRRTALTEMAKVGVEPVVPGHVANHRSATRAGVLLAIYVKRSYEAEKRRALELWADRLGAIVGDTGAKVAPLRRKAAR